VGARRARERSHPARLTHLVAWSAGPGRRSYVQLSADLAGESEVDLAVPRDHRAGTVRAGPAGVVPAFVDLPAALSA
jgi:hypothetical protein